MTKFFKSLDEIEHASARKLFQDAADAEITNYTLYDKYFRELYRMPADGGGIFGKRLIHGKQEASTAYANDGNTQVPGTRYVAYICRPTGEYGSYTEMHALDRGSAEYVLATHFSVELRNSDQKWSLGGPRHTVNVYGRERDPRQSWAYAHNCAYGAVARTDFMTTVELLKRAYEESLLAMWHSQNENR